MAHFAEIDGNNIVLRVIRVENSVIQKVDGTESELKGKQFLNTLLGTGKWVQTSYSHSFRKNFAGIGYTYDSTRDAFIAPKPPYDSWLLHEDTCRWKAPVEKPSGKLCEWDEENQEWINCVDNPLEN